MTTLTLCLLQNLLSFQSKFLLKSKVGFVPVGFVPFSLDNFLDLLQVAHKFIYKESHFKVIFSSHKSLRTGLTVFILEAAEFYLVGLVLSFLLQSAGSRGQFVLLFAGLGSALKNK